jgi:hypothetical protein
MTAAAERGEATRTDLAYLTDRVLLAEGQPQEYGTQMSGTEEGWAPKNLRDPDNVDARRAAVSLGPVSEYSERISRNYGPPKPSRLTCAECGGGIVQEKPPGNLVGGRAAPTARSHGAARGTKAPFRGIVFVIPMLPTGLPAE